MDEKNYKRNYTGLFRVLAISLFAAYCGHFIAEAIKAI